jgi:hypothetical protein
MDYRVRYEHSLKSDPGAFIVQVPSQLVDGIPSNILRALPPEYITELILSRSPAIGKIRNLRFSERHAPGPDQVESQCTSDSSRPVSDARLRVANVGLRGVTGHGY